jgi:hypothetical protein
MDIRLRLIAASDDRDEASFEEILNTLVKLREFTSHLEYEDANGMVVGTFEHGSLLCYDVGMTVIKVAQTLGSIGLGGIAGAWLQAKNGRKVRLKVGDIEAEAQTAEEVERLLAKAQEIQQLNEPKKIHDP